MNSNVEVITNRCNVQVVKSWDLNQFMAMGKEQRDAIRKALNEDAEKLLQQGDPADPQLRRLQREIDEVSTIIQLSLTSTGSSSDPVD